MVGVKLYVRLVVGLIRRILPVQDPSNDMIAIKIRAKGSEWRMDVSIRNRNGTLDPTLWDLERCPGPGKFLYAWRFRRHAAAPHARKS